MKKFLGLMAVLVATSAISACSMSLPTCHDELNECGRDAAYTEERTAQANKKRKNFAKKKEMPAVKPMPKAEPAPAPQPEPEPVVDTQVMRSAEPMVQHISK